MIELNEASSDWFEHAFGAMYARRYGHRDDTEAQRQVRQLVDWVKPAAGSSVLDVCCGGGRHLEPLLAMGFSAWGVDLSSDLLALASRRPALKGRLVRADARDLPFAGCFDWLVNLFTSFGYFRAEADNQRQLAGMVAALRPGGRLILDLPNRSYLENNLQQEDVQEAGDLNIVNRRWLEDDHIIKQSDVTTGSGEHHRFVERVRLYSRSQILASAQRAGLGEVSLHGGFSGGPLRADSDRMVVVGVRS